MLDNQDPFGLNRNDETGEAVYSNDEDDGNIESNMQFQMLCQGPW